MDRNKKNTIFKTFVNKYKCGTSSKPLFKLDAECDKHFCCIGECAFSKRVCDNDIHCNAKTRRRNLRTSIKTDDSLLLDLYAKLLISAIVVFMHFYKSQLRYDKLCKPFNA